MTPAHPQTSTPGHPQTSTQFTDLVEFHERVICFLDTKLAPKSCSFVFLVALCAELAELKNVKVDEESQEVQEGSSGHQDREEVWEAGWGSQGHAGHAQTRHDHNAGVELKERERTDVEETPDSGCIHATSTPASLSHGRGPLDDG